MSNLKSDVLFNRALLWMVLAGIDVLADASKWAIALQVACAIYNFWKSYVAWEDE